MKPFPLPVAPILLAKGMQTANGGVYRAVIAIALSYWAAGCSPLPDDEVSAAAIIRMPVATWRQHKNKVLQILAEITPRLDLEYRGFVRRREQLKKLGAKGQEARERNRTQMAAYGSTPSRGLDALARDKLPFSVTNPGQRKDGRPDANYAHAYKQAMKDLAREQAMQEGQTAALSPNQPATPAPAGRRTRPDFMSEAGLAVPARPQNASQAAPEPAKTAPKPPTHRAQRRQGDGPPIFR